MRRWDVLEGWINEHGWTRGAEIGVKRGQTYLYLLRMCPQLTLIGVDLFEPRPGLELEGGESNVGVNLPIQEAHIRRICQKHGDRAILLKGESLAVAQTIPDASLDFVFIDADHREFAVRADILAWLPKIKPRGTLCGHDYGPKANPADERPGVKLAVDALCQGVTLHPDSVWACVVG